VANLRPRELCVRRVLRYEDAARQTRAVLATLEERDFLVRIPAQHEDDRDSLVADATQKALERFDEVMRELALRRYHEFERELSPRLPRFAVEEIVRRIQGAGDLHWPEGVEADREVEGLVRRLGPDYGPWLAKGPALEDVTRISRAVAGRLKEVRALDDPADGLNLKEGLLS